MTDVTRLWRELASLGLARSAQLSPLNLFMADNLNLFFASISCASQTCDMSDFASVLRMPLPAHNQPAFKFATFTPELVSSNVLFSSSSSFAAGPDRPLFSLYIRLSPN